MNSKTLVKAAIHFQSPDRIPIWYLNRDFDASDVAYFDFSSNQTNKSVWGFEWESLDDGTMGQPKEPVIPTWEDMEHFVVPTPDGPEKSIEAATFKKSRPDKYFLAGMSITGFSIYTFLRGFENAMMDFVTDREKAISLMKTIIDYENQIITLAGNSGFDGIHFQDDWGTQHSLIISPALWRELFKPLYQKQFALAHEKGLEVWFHCCGNILEILPDFHEIGVDVMNISQPNVVNIETVGQWHRGKQTFLMPISYQTVSIDGTPQDIAAEAQRLHAHLGTERGGFIGYVEDYQCMGMSEENYQACIDAFQRLSSNKKKDLT